MGPEQLQGAIDTFIELMASRLKALKDIYRQGMGAQYGKLNVLSDKSRKLLTDMGLDPDLVEMRDEVVGLPPEARKQLTTEGEEVTFGNGQIWKLSNGKPVQVK